MTKLELAQQIFDDYYGECDNREFIADQTQEIFDWLDDQSVDDLYETVYLDWCEYCDKEDNDELELEQSLEEEIDVNKIIAWEESLETEEDEAMQEYIFEARYEDARKKIQSDSWGIWDEDVELEESDPDNWQVIGYDDELEPYEDEAEDYLEEDGD